jgi:hypothetical protein
MIAIEAPLLSSLVAQEKRSTCGAANKAALESLVLHLCISRRDSCIAKE